MIYRIDCVGTSQGWRYRVALRVGSVEYRGTRTYERHSDAERAARRAVAAADNKENGNG